MVAVMLRVRLAIMPPHVADEYSRLAQRDNLTIAEKAKVNVLEDTYSPSGQQVQAAISEAHAGNRRSKSTNAGLRIVR